MADFFDELHGLVNDILEFKVTKDVVSLRIEELKNKYGEDVFPSIHFQKASCPWDEAYFQKLKRMNITGACSEEFILHMAEVGDYIASRKKKFVMTIAVIGIIIAIGVLLLIGGIL